MPIRTSARHNLTTSCRFSQCSKIYAYLAMPKNISERPSRDLQIALRCAAHHAQCDWKSRLVLRVFSVQQVRFLPKDHRNAGDEVNHHSQVWRPANALLQASHDRQGQRGQDGERGAHSVPAWFCAYLSRASFERGMPKKSAYSCCQLAYCALIRSRPRTKIVRPCQNDVQYPAS